jgi:hypothetical protein
MQAKITGKRHPPAEFGKGVPIWDGPKGYDRFLTFVNQCVVNWYANCLTLSVLVI